MSVPDGYGEVVAEGSSLILDEKSSTSCALAARSGEVLLAWTGSDYRINLLWSADGRVFEGKQTLGHRSSKTVQTSSSVGSDGFSQTTTSTEPLAPALAVAHRGRFMAWTGTDGRPNVWGADLPGPAHAVLPERTGHPPALSPWRDELALAWTGSDCRLNVAWTQGGAFGGPYTFDETSAHGPALAGVGDELALAWTGTDRRLNVLVTQGGRFGPPRMLDETSSQAPALCALDGLLVLGWTGTDRRLNVMALGPGYVGTPARLPATTGCPPVLCAHDGSLLLAWTGSDRHLNVARLHRPT